MVANSKGTAKVWPALIVVMWLLGGSVMLIAQGEPGACDIQPVALAHLTLAMTPLALCFLRDSQVRYMRIKLLL